MENFLNVLTEDEVVREQFLMQTTPKGAYLVAKPYIDEMTEEEFISELSGIAKFIDEDNIEEISKESMVTVSGGSSFDKVMKTFKKHF